MAKCILCNSRKGKRKCARENGPVCSVCCGETREAEHCQGCEFFRRREPRRNYADIPRFTTQQMDDDSNLQSYANTVEATLCLWDHYHGGALADDSAIRVIEMLLDRFYYCDSEVASADPMLLEGLDMVLKSMAEDLSDVPVETVVKILGVIHFVARRRTRGGREYFAIIHQYAGLRGGRGIRILPTPME